MTLAGESTALAALRAEAEAAAWIALLHSPERNAAIESGLRRWIAEDPVHAAAWELATDLWNETAGLPRRIPRWRARSLTRNRFLRPIIALGIGCLVISGLALHYFGRSTVTTAVGEQRTLNLEDGTRVALNTDSRLVVKYDRQARTVILNSGEAYFNVAHERRPFVVVVGERKVIAAGTSFTVRRDQSAGDAVTVTLIEGRVAVAPVGAANVLLPGPVPEVTVLSAGERLRVRRHTLPTLDAPPIDKVTGWMRGQLIFDHTPLREAVAEFNRYSPIRITVASAEAGQIPVGGIFRISDSRSFARAVAESQNLRLITRDGELVLEDSQPDSPPQDPTSSGP